MNNANKKYIYVFGSYRKYLKFKTFFNDTEYTLVFISGESEDEASFVKTKDQLLAEFNSHYEQSQIIEAMISFGKGSLIGSIEAIAETFEIIKNKYPNCSNAQFIGPSEEAAKIFCNKYLTYQALSELNIPVPNTFESLGNSVEEILNNVPKNINFPVVLKAENLSGGRGMRYLKNPESLDESIRHFYSLGINRFIISEYVSGVEATFTVLRLGDTFLRLPTSYKNETSSEMVHPDAKVKIAGVFQEFDEYFEMVEKVMREHDISGFFSLQGVLLKNGDKYSVVFLEAAPRMTGSTPIMESSLIGFNIFETISEWVKNKTIEFAYTKRLSLQYSSYIHDGKTTAQKLKEYPWVIEAKYEDLSKMPYSEESRSRIRISFFVENADKLQQKLETIDSVCHNENYAKEVNDVFAWFQEFHNILTTSLDKKVLEGIWSEDAKWEFYLSSTLPSTELCSAVFGIPKTKKGFLLTKTKRGWELPGGHIEKNEKIIETLKREVTEEVGFTIERALLYGYRKVITSKVLYSKEGEPYPYPVSYIPHFLVASNLAINKPTGEDVFESNEFKFESLEVENSQVKEIIKIGAMELKRVS